MMDYVLLVVGLAMLTVTLLAIGLIRPTTGTALVPDRARSARPLTWTVRLERCFTPALSLLCSLFVFGLVAGAIALCQNQVSFDVSSPTAVGRVPITFGGATSLAALNTDPLSFTTQGGGSITIGRASKVMTEPASLVLCAVGGGLILAGCLRRRQYAPLGV
jgi:hypothetical protein